MAVKPCPVCGYRTDTNKVYHPRCRIIFDRVYNSYYSNARHINGGIVPKEEQKLIREAALERAFALVHT